MAQRAFFQIPFAEAACVSAVCPQCKTQIVFDFREKPNHERLSIAALTRRACPGCAAHLDAPLTDALTDFHRWLESAERAEEAGHEVALVVDAP
jgi:hypothetical protein